MCDKSPYEVYILFEGYSTNTEDGKLANCTCTLIKGPQNIIVDTMTAWDGEKLKRALAGHCLSGADINYVVCTHGHSDHIGCNYLFLNATHIVGYCISRQNKYINFEFTEGEPFVIDKYVKVIATPGHTLQDVSVLVEVSEMGILAITGDLFENECDVQDDSIWKDAGSGCEKMQEKYRKGILKHADYIIPGHGKMFKVSDVYDPNAPKKTCPC